MSKKVGIIAEDKSDVAAIKILIHRLGATPIGQPLGAGDLSLEIFDADHGSPFDCFRPVLATVGRAWD